MSGASQALRMAQSATQTQKENSEPSFLGTSVEESKIAGELASFESSYYEL